MDKLFRTKKIWLILAALLLGVYFFSTSNQEVPILMYHRVGESNQQPGINVSTKTFERQMEFLKSHRYNVMRLSDLLELIKTGQKIPANTVVVTFDDGYLDNFKNAFPILKKMHFPATIFMITNNINKEDWLSDEDLRILDASGISIESHTANHAFLPDIPSGQVVSEIRDSRNKLEKILGHPVFLLSYPAGGVTEEIKSLAEKEGYRGAVTTNYGKKRYDPFALHRIKVTEGRLGLFDFWIKTSGLYHLGKRRVDRG